MGNSTNELINFILEENKDAEKALSLVKTDFDKFIYNHYFEKKFDVKFSPQKEFENLFNEIVPSSGKANTVIGEIFRGYNKLMYRLLNDGDEIECGPYSGINYGIRYEFDVPFVVSDNGIEWTDYYYMPLNNLGCIDRDVITNISFNCLILNTFEEFHRKNDVDISKYYDNIVNFLIDEEIIDAFKKHDIDITHNFGSYGNHFNNYYYDSLSINSVAEDLYIYFENGNIRIEFYPSFMIRFKLEFDSKEIDTILDMYGDLLRCIVYYATVDYKKHLSVDEWKEKLNKIGFTVNEEKYIICQESPLKS